MNPTKFGPRVLPLMTALCVAGASFPIAAEDIDIFVSNINNSGTQGVPNVLIMLDNTSNWSRTEFAGNPSEQGRIEVRSIKSVLAGITNMNVGVMLANDLQGNADPGAFVHYGMKFMEATSTSGNNKYYLNQRLDAIDNNIGTPQWKGPSSLSYGGMMFNAFKYFGGYTSPANVVSGTAGTPTDATHFGPIAYQGGSTPSGAAPGLTGIPMLDPDAYTTPSITVSTNSYPNLTYRSPETAIGEECGASNYIIFISNKSPNDDTSSNLLTNVGGSLTPRVPRPATTQVTVSGVKTYVQDPNGGESTPNDSWYMPEWARFLRKTDVSSLPGQQNVVTYTINVYQKSDNANQQQGFSSMLMATAKAGGGKYFLVTQNAQLDIALQTIFAEIQAKSSTFASAALPISSTNRAQNLNQVYIGMFRPNQDATPRWFGNLKRYQLARISGGIQLADALGAPAVNNNTGFVTECAASYWSTDSATYWSNVAINPPPIGLCTANVVDPTTGTAIAHDPYSDYPDGPLVEKGAVAEVLRKRDTATTPRVIKTSAAGSGTALTDFGTGNSAVTAVLSNADIKFVRGEDINDENADSSITDVRASVHGDVVHSRPLPISYNASVGGTMIYYGSNDGTFRAVDADTGVEKWAYVAPEFYPSGATPQPFARLRTQSPVINYSGVTDPTAIPKNYFFDGSTGLYQSASNDKVWLYPTMRRGGRMLYSFDVSGSSPPALPTIKWKVGCPNLTNDTGCLGGIAEIGQTWSTPIAARVNTSGTIGTFTRVVLVGGGYDPCEDADQKDPTCAVGAKGNRVYIIDADTGAVLRQFTTTGRVPSDVAVIDVDYDGIVDYAYVGDTVGNVYRITFGLSKTAPLAQASWTMDKIAGTTGAGRKFLYPPALVAYHHQATGKDYVYLAFGSGDREKPLEAQYPYRQDVKNRFYMFVDDLSRTSTSSPALSSTDLDGSDMLDVSTDTLTLSSDCSQGVVPGTTNATYQNKKGWYLQYSNGTGNAGNQGEQTVTSAVIVAGQVAWSTNRPIHASGAACSPTGEAKGYFVNLFNASGTIGPPNNLSCGGERSDVFVKGALPPSPVLATVVINGVPSTVLLGAADKGGGTSTIIQGQEGFTLPPQKRSRVYWKQDIDN